MEKSGRSAKAEKAIPDGTEMRETCGIVMPISAIDGCDPSHWANVLEILEAASRSAGYEPKLVSTGADIGVIQGRIVQNLYDNPIVVCDVSGKNPNVMFELGMRLAFDKPVIIVKDDATSYSFDTSPIEHLEYRRDLRYQNAVEFQKLLAQRIKATVERSREDDQYSPFLKHFGKFTVAKLNTQEVSSNEYLMKKMDDLQREVSSISSMWHGQSPRKLSDQYVPDSVVISGEKLLALRTSHDPVHTENQVRKLIEEELGNVSDRVLQQGIDRLTKRSGHLPITDARFQELLSEYLRRRSSVRDARATS